MGRLQMWHFVLLQCIGNMIYFQVGSNLICFVSCRSSFDDDDNDFPSSFMEELAYMEMVENEGSPAMDSLEMSGQVGHL
jgi:hypothetical protein